MHVLAFHGAGASPERLARDMGNPPWVTCYPKYKRKSPEQFAEEFRICYGRDKVVLVGYSDGGDFCCDLTRTELAEDIAGIIVYESPARALPKVLPVPVVMIWNDYDPIEKYIRFVGRRRQAIKDASIAAWSRYESVRKWTGNISSHVYWASSWPFLRHAWDQSLNVRLARFVKSVDRAEFFEPPHLNHTPEPWEIRDWDVDADDKLFNTVERLGYLDIVADGGTVAHVVADTCCGSLTSECRDNAKLIANSPAMADCIRRLAPWASGAIDDPKVCDGLKDIYRQAIDIAEKIDESF